jgi:hypothetical protein
MSKHLLNTLKETNSDPKWTEEQRRELEQVLVPKPDQRSIAWYNSIYNHL